MRDFLVIFFFSGSTLLTQTPINITQTWTELTPAKPLVAITGGGTLYIDITNTVGDINDVGVLDKKLPRGTIEAELVPEKGQTVKLVNGSAYSFSNKTVSAIMLTSSEMPTNVKFRKVRLRSAIPLKSAKLTWSNSTL